MDKTILTHVFHIIVSMINGLKRAWPFHRVYLIADSKSWIKVDYPRIVKEQLFSTNIVHYQPFKLKGIKKTFPIDGGFRKAEYQGVNLYNVAKYNICVELEEYPSVIDIENEHHRFVIAKWFARSAECIDYFEKLVAKTPPAKVLICQGHSYDAAVVRALACKYGFGVIAVENTFNKNKIIWENISGITVNKNLAKNFYWKYCDFISDDAAGQYVKGYLENIKDLKSGEHQTPGSAISKTDKKTVLFIGQVYTDSSVLFGINDFRCPVEIICHLVEYCLENDYQLIIKLHPKEAVGNDVLNQPYNHLTYRKLSQQAGLFEKIADGGFVLDKDIYDTYSLIDSADVCVTVNSQAGLEALLKGKELIVCGQGYYTGLGITLEAFNKLGLLCALDQVLKHGVSILNQAEVNKFFYILSEKYFLDRSERTIKKLLTKAL